MPKPVQVPVLDSTKLKNREFVVKKGSDLAKFHIYMDGKTQNSTGTGFRTYVVYHAAKWSFVPKYG